MFSNRNFGLLDNLAVTFYFDIAVAFFFLSVVAFDCTLSEAAAFSAVVVVVVVDVVQMLYVDLEAAAAVV